MKIVFLEGRTDLFYLEKLHTISNIPNEALYLPCGGASEIWPVIQAIKWSGKFDGAEFEAWVDNDNAGHEAQSDIMKRYEDVKVRVLGQSFTNGSIEDLVGFLVPKTYEDYVTEKQNKKYNKRQYQKTKNKLFSEIMALREISQDKYLQIKKFFKRVDLYEE